MAQAAPAPDPLAPSPLRGAGTLDRPAGRRIAEVIGAAPRGLTVREIVEAVGLHHTTVRIQLERLVASGALEVGTDAPTGPGRPPLRYVQAPRPAERRAAAHRALVRLLMTLVREMEFDAEEVERFGSGQGAALVRPGGGLEEVRETFTRLGFEPRPPCAGRPGEVVLGRCPFGGPGGAAPDDLVCRMHRGLVRGMVQVAAPDLRLADFGVRDVPGASCRMRLA